MAWPSDVATGNIIFAADVNAAYLAARAWGGNVDAGGHDLQSLGNLYAPGQTRCHIFNSQAQSIPNAEWTDIVFDTEAIDVGGMHDVGNPSRITFPVYGVYLVTAGVAFPANATGLRYVALNVLGSIRTHQINAAGLSVDGNYMQTTALFYRGAGEWLDVQVYQSSGGSLILPVATSFAVVQRLS